MAGSDDNSFDNRTSLSGWVTPPLSPSKTASTSGWTSPRTPCSPRKIQSHPFLRPRDYDSLELAIDSTPTKAVVSLRGPVLWPPPFYVAGHEPQSSPISVSHGGVTDGGDDLHVPEPSGNACLDQPVAQTHGCDRDLRPSLRPASHSVLSGVESESKIPASTADINPSRHLNSSLSESASPSSGSGTPTITCTPLDPTSSTNATSSEANVPPPKSIRKIAPRSTTSPLRPNQWVTRGGMLSSPRGLSRTPDRYIPVRRPPAVTRDSYEMARAEERLKADERVARGSHARVDPFGRRLPRSARLNDELRGLREAHATIIGRANHNNTHNRNALQPNSRRSPLASAVRQVSAGAIWNVGGPSAAVDTVVGVPTGTGGMLGTGTNAPLYTSMFLNRSDPEAELEAYERRLALALDVDQRDRVLDHSPPASFSLPVPSSPIRVLDAPQLRDDYYCSLIAYSFTARCLAVGLGTFVHLWSERKGVNTPESLNSPTPGATAEVQHVTTLAFSSTQGGQAILAVGRADGRLTLWSPFDSDPRFNAEQPKAISCVSFRPTIMKRPSLRDRAMIVPTEELLVGDEVGHVYFYSVEWPSETDCAVFGWHGALTLLARLTIHTQQICGLSWSVDGELFASGGNDNACYLFETRRVLHHQDSSDEATTLDVHPGPNGENVWTVTPGRNNVLAIELGREKHKWELNAAVKAMAFCPWQRGLLAVGGGSNDRCIHFYHTISGVCLATIDCAAQVTSLVWSTTRRELAATFGFAQPEHPYRVAVFAWPSCEQVVAIPWYDENRALYAIAYPGGPNTGRERGEDGVWSRHGAEEGCLVVAASDSAIRFHEIWTDERRSLRNGVGILGGSDILESLHGIEKEGEMRIR